MLQNFPLSAMIFYFKFPIGSIMVANYLKNFYECTWHLNVVTWILTEIKNGTTHGNNKEKRCKLIVILWVAAILITHDHHLSALLFWWGVLWFILFDMSCSMKEYEEKAVSLALNRPKLQALTNKLKSVRMTCPLFDTARWVCLWFNIVGLYVR